MDKICEQEWINVVMTHSAPQGCYPATKGLVSSYAEYDSSLVVDTDQERNILRQLFDRLLANQMPIARWYYGHFHESKYSEIEGVLFKLLDVMEMDCIPARFG